MEAPMYNVQVMESLMYKGAEVIEGPVYKGVEVMESPMYKGVEAPIYKHAEGPMYKAVTFQQQQLWLHNKLLQSLRSVPMWQWPYVAEVF